MKTQRTDYDDSIATTMLATSEQLADAINNAGHEMQQHAFEALMRNSIGFNDLQRGVYAVENYCRAGERLMRANADCRVMIAKIGKI